MNKKMLQAIVKRLNEIKKRVNISINRGICTNLATQDSEDGMYIGFYTHCWLIMQFKTWPECHKYEDGDKDIYYPVGGVEEYTSARHDGTLWDNPKRPKLLDYLIEQAEQELKEMN